MRNFTVMAVGLAALMAMPAAAEKASPLKMIKDMKAIALKGQFPQEGRQASPQLLAPQMRMSELARKIKPGKVKTYGWDGSEWLDEDLYDYSYDAAGNVISELCKDAEGDCSKTVSEYNENGKVILKDVSTSSDGVDFKGYRKSAFEYDPIITDVITRRTESIFMNGEWRPDANNYRRIITRDEQGNITSVVIAVLFDGEYDPTQRLTVTYGDDGTATEIAEEILDYDGRDYFWVPGLRIFDIVWDKTDGQIWDVESVYSGNNRIKSGVMTDEGIDMKFTVEYAEEGDGYKLTVPMDDLGMPMTMETEYTPLENDGYHAEIRTLFMGMVMGKVVEEVRYDDWGLMTLQSQKVESYEGNESDEVIGDVEYDAEGRPEVYTVREEYSESGDDEVYVDYIIKAEYSDYIDVTAGVGGLNAGQAAPEIYYDLNGVRVAAPEKGRIVVTASGEKKVF